MQKTITLKKVYREIWSKKRGSAERTFSGHKVDYFIDSVPIQEKDYISRISEIAGDESRFRLLTSPTMFPSLHWQKQRALLLEICGDISDADIIESDPKLKPLTKILGKRTLDDHRKIVIARKSEINKEMERIPVRIDEVRRGIPDITGLNREALEQENKHIEDASNDAKLRLQGVNTGGNIAELSRKLAGLNEDLRNMEEAHRAKSLSELNRLNQDISELSLKITSFNRSVGSINNTVKVQLIRLQSTEPALEQLRKRWVDIDAEQFKDTTIDTCPACGQSLPVDRIKEAKEKALANFNQDKAERLGEIDRKGHALKDEKTELQKQVNDQMAERDRMQIDIISLEKQLQSLEQDRYSLKTSSEDFSNLQGYADLLDEIEALNGQIEEERKGKAQDIERIKEEIAAHGLILSASKENLNKFSEKEQREKRIEELKAEEKKLSAEYERLEGELYLTEQFIKTKVAMLTDRINAKFETVRFKLFNVLINGGIEDCCEITVGGVPFDGGLNNGARINAGLEIVKVLQQHYQLKAPVFADNAEAVNKLFDVGSQMIRLFVSEDKELRVEFEKVPERIKQRRMSFRKEASV